MFAADIQRWATPEDLSAYLSTRPTPSWAKGLIIHHTVLPLPPQWRGYASMRNIIGYYRDTKKWTAGPHLFVCHGSPHPEDDGIWQMTPVDTRGVHAGACNADAWGMEVVGRYDSVAWPPALQELVIGTAAAMLRWKQLDADGIRGHRDCHSPKTCPGSAIDMVNVRNAIRARLGVMPPTMIRYTANSPLMNKQPLATEAQCLRYLLNRGPWGEYNEVDVRTIIRGYWDTCKDVGVDPVLMVAQMIHETGGLRSWWAGRPRRNPAGLGATGRTIDEGMPPSTITWAKHDDSDMWSEGLSFASWTVNAIPAHVGRILAYVYKPTATLSALQSVLRKNALALRALPTATQGSAQTLITLGKAHNPSGQGWASPGTEYGQRIAAIAQAIATTVA